MKSPNHKYLVKFLDKRKKPQILKAHNKTEALKIAKKEYKTGFTLQVIY